jgi:hypothetical protein
MISSTKGGVKVIQINHAEGGGATRKERLRNTDLDDYGSQMMICKKQPHTI